MAVRTFADITGTLVKLFYNDVTNSINRAVVLGQLLETKPGTGQNIQWPAQFGTESDPAAAVIADGADVSVYNRDKKIPAVLQYGTYHDAFEVTGKAAAAAAVARNPSQLADLFGQDMKDAAQRLAHAIGAHTYSGSGASDTIHGLTATAGPLAITGTYAGIDKAVDTQWQANQVDAQGAGISFALMREMDRVNYDACGEPADIIICDPTQHEKYGLLFGSERRYVDHVFVAGKKITLSGGYKVLEHDGVSVIRDRQATSGQMLFLNSRHLYMSQLPDALTSMKQSMGFAKLAGTFEEQYGNKPIGIQARVIPLAKTGDSYKFQLICYPQLVSRRNNCHGSIINLA